jgi:PAS domain-containing protein
VLGTLLDVTDRKRAEAERQAQLWFLESMDKVSRTLQESTDLGQMMTGVLDAVLTIFECDRAELQYPCDPEAASYRVPMRRTRPGNEGAVPLGVGIPIDRDIARVYRLVLDSSGPVRFDPVSGHSLVPEAEGSGIKSLLATAIHPKLDKPYEFVLQQCSHPRVWMPQEERLFQEIGRRLADALDMLLMLRSLRDSERKLEEAQRISHVGYWELDLATNCSKWSNEAFRIFGLQPRNRPMTYEEIWRLIHPRRPGNLEDCPNGGGVQGRAAVRGRAPRGPAQRRGAICPDSI